MKMVVKEITEKEGKDINLVEKEPYGEAIEDESQSKERNILQYSHSEEDVEEDTVSKRKERRKELVMKQKIQKFKKSKIKKIEGSNDNESNVSLLNLEIDLKDSSELPTMQDIAWEHDKQPPILAANVVPYCSICGLPPDYCEYGGYWEECKKVVMSRYPHFYPQFINDTDEVLSNKLSNLKIRHKKKVSNQVEEVIEIALVNRAKRKSVTVVRGLNTHGVKLDQAAKLFAKVFSCGSSVVKDAEKQSEQIDIQGDVRDSIVNVIISNFPQISENQIVFLP